MKDEKLLNFMKHLTEAKRSELIVEIAAEFRRQVFSEQGKIDATVEVAEALSASEAKEVSALVEKITGKSVSLATIVNPKLLAGLRIQVEGKTIDATLASRIDNLHRKLLRADA